MHIVSTAPDTRRPSLGGGSCFEFVRYCSLVNFLDLYASVSKRAVIERCWTRRDTYCIKRGSRRPAWGHETLPLPTKTYFRMPGNFHAVPEWILEQWPEPNYIDPVRRTWMAPFALVFPAVSTILIAGRFWLRATKQSGAFGLDDLFIGIGWVSEGTPRYGLSWLT